MSGWRLRHAIARFGVAALVSASGVVLVPGAAHAVNGTVVVHVTGVGGAELTSAAAGACLAPAVPAGTAGCSDGSPYVANPVGASPLWLSLPPGTYNVGAAAFSNGGFSFWGPQPATMVGGDTVTLTFGFALVSGYVTGLTESATVSACAGAPPGPSCPVPLSSAMSNPMDGSYSLYVAPGPHELAVMMGTAVTSSVAVNLAAGDSLGGVDFALSASDYATLTGTVTGTDAGNLGVAACLDPDVPNPTGPGSPGCAVGRVVFAPGGSYTLLLGPGTWNVAGAGSYPAGIGVSAVQEFVLSGGDSVTASFVVSPPSVTLTGRVSDVSGDPFTTGFTVVGACPGGGTVDTNCTGLRTTSPSPLDGSYTLGLSPGLYSVAAFNFPNGYPNPPVLSSGTGLVTIVQDETLVCDFVIGGGPPDCDGITDAIENGAPNDGDGNGDGIPDAQQENVTSLPNALDSQYVTVEAPPGMTLVGVEATDPATLSPPPPGVSLPVGVLNFEVHGVTPGATVSIDVFTPPGTSPNSYFKFDDPNWIDFTANATFAGDVVTLTLTDGGAGDADGVANGVIVDPGAPAVATFDFTGFFSPVNNPTVLNVAKAGSAIPVKFSLDGDQGLEIFAPGYPKSQLITCGDDPETDGIEQMVTAGQSSLTYDPAFDTYTYVWKTDKAWAGTCRQLVVKLSDDTQHRANFQFK